MPKPNKPCHCGSGKKYKKCCMRDDDMRISQQQTMPQFVRPQERMLTPEETQEAVNQGFNLARVETADG